MDDLTIAWRYDSEQLAVRRRHSTTASTDGCTPPQPKIPAGRGRRISTASSFVAARAALAGSLLDSLDTEVDEDAEAAWATEVTRRVTELDSGAVKTIPWAEVRRRLAAR